MHATDDQTKIANLLHELVAIESVNPMGRPYEQAMPVERGMVEFLERLFSPYDVEMYREPCSPIHESLVIKVPGSKGGAGTLLEAHMDTVPADDWADRAFRPCRQGDDLVGRGACDDKGSLAAMAFALTQMLEAGAAPPQTVWLLAAGDEEYAQTGIKHFLAKHSDVEFGRAIFGEPTECMPVVQHKGAIRWDLTICGRSAHSSQPELGRNAILETMRVIELITQHQRELSDRYPNPLLSGPTITVTMIHGGRSTNIVPDECTISIDFRIVPGMDRQRSVDELLSKISDLNIPYISGDFQCLAPALNTSPDEPFVGFVCDTCSEVLEAKTTPQGAPYCSDACWMPESVPTIVFGPGNIDHAHAVDERINVNQVLQCANIYQQIVEHDWSLVEH